MKLAKLSIIFFIFINLTLYAQNPGGVSGASFWYKSNAGITINTGVSQWDDQSGNTRHLSQSSSTARPVFNSTANLINFNETIGFDGSNDVLRTAGINRTDLIGSTSPYTISTYIVYKAKSLSAILLNHSSGSGDVWNIGLHTGFNLVANRKSSVTNPILNEIRLQSMQGITNGAVSSRLNGTVVGSTWETIQNVSSTNSQPLWVGAQGTNGFGSSEIAEIISFPNNTNSNNERQKIESYLGIKYGITLPFSYLASDETVVWDATANSIYNKNIFGIGRDNSSGLNQKQSQSSNIGLQAIVSSGSIAVSNSENVNSISSDKQFLIIGDNGLTGYESFSDTFGNPNIFSRSSKVWYAENTGNYSQSTTIFIPTEFYNGLTSPTLILSSSNTFESTELTTTNSYISAEAATISINSVLYYEFKLSSEQVENDFYFSLANGIAPGGVSIGLAAWYKANDEVSSPSQWNDFSGNNKHLSQNTTSRRPNLVQSQTNGVFEFNFNPYFNFNALNQQYFYRLTGIYGTNATAGSIYSVAKSANPTQGTWQTIAGFGDDNPNLSQATDHYELWRNNGQIYRELHNVRSLPAHGVSMFWSQTNGNSLSLNGRLFAGGNSSGNITDNVFTIGSEGFNVSPTSTGNEHYTGGIPEVLVYSNNHALNLIDKNKIDSYLALKYGTTLNQTSPQNYVSSNGTVVWNSTTNASYTNNIAGLSKDDFSNFHQKQAKSVNAGMQIIMSTASVFTTNTLNSTSINNNLQYLIWGDNNLTGTTSFSDTFSNPSILRRYSRVWKVTNTGNYNQETKLYIPINIYNGFGIPLLIKSTDEAFSSTLTSTTNTYINGEPNLVTINNVKYFEYILDASELTSEFYFTIVEIDSDNDSIHDGIDIDDDNDGVLDVFEMNCANSTLQKSNILITSELNYSYANGASNLQGLIDSVESAQVSNPNGVFPNKTWLKFQFATPLILKNIEIGHANSQILFASGSTFSVQGSNDDTNWFTIINSQTYTNSSPVLATNNSAKINLAINNSPYKFYRLFGISGSSGGGNAQEIYFTELSCSDIDSDNDNLSNRLDLDSDGDSCFDAQESGVPLSKFDRNTGIITGIVSNNGFANDLETFEDSGILNYTLNYSNAIDNLTILCFCTKDPNTNLATSFTNFGISTYATKRTGWPETVPNGFIVLESKNKGFVITRISTLQRDALTAKEGMLIYNTTNTRVELYNGTEWIGISRSCNE